MRVILEHICMLFKRENPSGLKKNLRTFHFLSTFWLVCTNSLKILEIFEMLIYMDKDFFFYLHAEKINFFLFLNHVADKFLLGLCLSLPSCSKLWCAFYISLLQFVKSITEFAYPSFFVLFSFFDNCIFHWIGYEGGIFLFEISLMMRHSCCHVKNL